jgi:8-oxo-dGTP pyrophosphatase MutT (NUDIX family)
MNQKQGRRPNRQKAKASRGKVPRGSRATREYTAGGVVYRRLDGDRIEILMIQDRLGRWTIPKGHVEEGEKIEQTALREVTEETGLTQLRLGEKLDKLHFFYRKEGKLIFMTTYVFLMEATGDDETVVPEDSEGIVDAQWFDQAKALELIEYRDTEKLFRLALDKITGVEAPKSSKTDNDTIKPQE